MSSSARFGFVLSLALSAGVWAAESPWIHRIEPLGAQRGTQVEVRITGTNLVAPDSVWFDTPGIRWVTTSNVTGEEIAGKIEIAPDAALGPHLFHLKTREGRTNTRLFNVMQYPGVAEVEPNDPPGKAQRISLRPQVIQGYLKGKADRDAFEFEAKAGDRWTFDLRSIEYGSHLECDLALETAAGERVAFNDDRDDYLETPFLEHTFRQAGTYRLVLDQYRGPQRVDCSENCGYLLQISQLPVVSAIDPLGAEAGSSATIRIVGKGLDRVQKVELTPVRLGEYYRLTFPFTLPLRAVPDAVATPVSAAVATKRPDQLTARFTVPVEPAGLWRVWLHAAHGTVEAGSFEVGQTPEQDEDAAKRKAWSGGPAVVNGRLGQPGEEDRFWIEAEAGHPIHIYTLAVQMGLPLIDTVLELFDADGKLVAESDDLMSGQGTVIGNPDSSLYYRPQKTERVQLVVRERIGRGGPSYVYRLKFDHETPGFRLLTEPEEFRITRGGKAEMEILLIKDPGFAGAVEVWAEGLPAGLSAGKASFREDQYFGVSGDGDNVVIPTAHLSFTASEGLLPGEYPIRVLGRSASCEQVIEAFTTLWIGPPGKRNDVRRPLPAVTVTVVDRAAAPAKPTN